MSVVQRLILHEYVPSGNCYKIRLTAALLGIALERRHYDIIAGETRTTAFLAGVNANGRIPVLQMGDRYLPESNAACWWLAEDTRLIPADRDGRAGMLQWMFFEQYSHEPNIATLRFWRAFLGEAALTAEQRGMIPARLAAGQAALKVMDDHLATRRFMVGDALSLADICLYAYTHVAGEGGVDLAPFPAVRAWLAAIEGEPGYVPLAA